MSAISNSVAFRNFSPTLLADVLGAGQVMDSGIRSLGSSQQMERVVGPAFTVRCAPGDNLMLHAAIYRAEPGSVVVVESGERHLALAGGNVCAIAERRGIAAFILDGMIRDLAEVRALGFPVFARGVIPCAAAKDAVAPLNRPVQCGGVTVEPGDIIVADEEGIVVVPHRDQDAVRRAAQDKMVEEADLSLDGWEQAHRARVDELLHQHGFRDQGR